MTQTANGGGLPMPAGQVASWALQRELREQEEAWRHLDNELEHTLNMAEMEQDTQEGVMQRMQDLTEGLSAQAEAKAALQPSHSSLSGAVGATAAASTQKDLVDGEPIRYDDLIVSVKTAAAADELVEMAEEVGHERLQCDVALRGAEQRQEAAEALATHVDEMFRSMQARLTSASVDTAAQGLLKRNLSEQKQALQAELDAAVEKLADSEAIEVACAEAAAALGVRLQEAEQAVKKALEQSRSAQEKGATNAPSLAAEVAVEEARSSTSPPPPVASQAASNTEEARLDAVLAAPFLRPAQKAKTEAQAALPKPKTLVSRQATVKCLMCTDMGTQTEVVELARPPS